MHAFEDLESVHSALNRLEKREPPLVTMLPRQPGTKEVRYAHLLGDTPPATPAAPAHVPAARESDPAVASPSPSQRIESLVAEIAELRKQIVDLQSQFAAFRKQFE
jgi:uncharacterized protein YceH (UPF0502 family)